MQVQYVPSAITTSYFMPLLSIQRAASPPVLMNYIAILRRELVSPVQTPSVLDAPQQEPATKAILLTSYKKASALLALLDVLPALRLTPV